MLVRLNPDDCFPVRAEILSALELYANHHEHPGIFLRMVLENNLSESFGNASVRDANNLHNIIAYIRQHVPSDRWGSQEKVENWLMNENSSCLLFLPRLYSILLMEINPLKLNWRVIMKKSELLEMLSGLPDNAECFLTDLNSLSWELDKTAVSFEKSENAIYFSTLGINQF